MQKEQIHITPLGMKRKGGFLPSKFGGRKIKGIVRIIPIPSSGIEPPMRRKPMDASTVRLIKKLADNVDWQTRYRSAERLGKMRALESIDALCESLTKDKVSNVRACAAWALGRIGSTKALEALKAAENDPNARVRQTVELAISAIVDV